MTSMMLDDVRKRLRRAQLVIGLMLGVTAAGIASTSTAVYALVINALAWASWWASLLHSAYQVRKLEVRAEILEETIRRTP